MDLKTAIKNKEVKVLCWFLFNVLITPKQEDMVRRIAYSENKRLSICAMTRYGKTLCVAMGICLYILFNKHKKVALVAPQDAQAQVLRTYLAELIINTPILWNLTDFDTAGYDKLKKEVSRNRLTFKNGCEYRVFSAHGDANRLMGFGADIVVKDEACLISDEANTKIMRMLGDDPENAILIELYNPWDRANKAFEHTMNPDFKFIHIGWKDALKEGRITKSFVEEQRKELTPLEFTVLYDSEFPEQSEDAIFNLNTIRIAKESKLNLIEECDLIEKKLSRPSDYNESQIREIKEEFKEYTKIISADIGDRGIDETVIFWGAKKANEFHISNMFHEATSDNMAIAGRIVNLIKSFIGRRTKGLINIDCIGVGTGVLSRVKEFVREERYKNIKVKGCNFGESAIKKERFLNKKAENYFRLKDIFTEKQIKIIDNRKLTMELMSMKWELTSAGKIRIIDPEKSPDYADSIVYFIWKDKSELSFAFG